jgi:hypothetical protein
MAKFLFLLQDNPSDYANLSPSDMQRIVAEYTQWAQHLAAQGKLVAGEKLADEGGKHLRSHKGTVVVTDGPFIESKEVLGGYFVVEASDYDDAVAIAKTCPHIRYGAGTILRRIEEMPA